MKNFIKFWLLVINRSFKKLWNLIKEQVVVSFFLVILNFGFTYFVTRGIFVYLISEGADSDVISNMRILIGIFIFILPYFLINIIIQPVKIYEEMGGFLEGLEIVVNSIEFSHNNERSCVSVEIINKSIYPIDNFYPLIKNQFMNFPERISGFDEERFNLKENKTITIPAEDQTRCYIAVAWLKEPTAHLLAKNDKSRKLEKGIYYLTLFINGTCNGALVRHHEEFILNYSGGNKISLIKANQ